ncbi:Gfo/Idh/MocA family protein [Photorhabdus laumondii]|uniref:Gfo/Idh/MocA family protein n=1 Tax=Photorhabdus laumondii TaxID=2218628 RepID=UPI0025AF63AA|nr:Gfo/Idh/MocA family oxidoreductase [Photorhabdus laumondii]
MKLAIIGCGNIVLKEHIPTINTLGIEIVGLCDILEENIIEARKLINYKIPSYSCYQEMLEEVPTDSVLVALPHYMYEDVIKYCSRKKLKIIKEKPFAISINQAKKLKQLAYTNNVELFTVCQKRYTKSYRQLKSVMDENNGKLKQIKIRYTIPSKDPNSNWRGKYSNAGGGVWLDMGYHIVDLLCYLFDCHEINVNYSKLINTSNGKYNVDDTAFVEFQYGNVIIFVYISCVAYEKYEDITLIGDDFIVYANRNQLKIKNKKQEVISEKYFHPDDESPFVDMYQDFLFSKEKDSFSNNLKNSIVITNLLENAFIESGYKII